MSGLRLAISFLTVLPVPTRAPATDMAPALSYFPLVGLALGGVLAGIDFGLESTFPPPLRGAMLVVALVVLTRALHIEGFMDTCDGLLGGGTRERRLEILRDSHVGAFAVTGGVAILLLKWTAVVGLPPEVRVSALVLFPCLSRWAMLLAVSHFSYARSQGLGTSFLHGRRRVQVPAGLVTVLTASLLLAGAVGAVLLAVATAVAWGLGAWMAGQLGGLTGDTYGAVNEVAEVLVLVSAIAVVAVVPALVGWPLPWSE